jgi:hypothetical protein
LEGQRPPSDDNSTEGLNDIVFISYAREDSVAARRLYDDLKKAGLNPWLDKESILVARPWKTEISEAIKKSRHFIPILSKRSVEERGYVHKELKYALDI